MAATATEHSTLEEIGALVAQMHAKTEGMEERLKKQRADDLEKFGVKADGAEFPNLQRLQDDILDLHTKFDQYRRARKAGGENHSAKYKNEARFHRKRLTAADSDGYRDAIDGYIRKGDDGLTAEQASLLRFDSVPGGITFSHSEKSALSADFDQALGWMAPPTVEQQVDRLVKEISTLDAHARVVTIGTGSYEGYIRNTNRDPVSGRGDRQGTETRTEQKRYIKRTITIYEKYSEALFGKNSLDDIARDVEAESSEDASEELAVIRGRSFVKGSGSEEAMGLAHPEAGYLEATTGVDGQITPDSLRKLPYLDELKAPYRIRGKYGMSRGAIRDAMLWREDTGAGPGTGPYMWQPTLVDGTPSRLNGFPWFELVDLDAPGVGTIPVYFGDFMKGYRIVNRRGINILRDPYSNKPNIAITYSMRYGGSPWITEALVGLKCTDPGKA